MRYRTLGGRASRQQERSFGTSRREADDFALKIEHDKRAHVFIDPAAGDVLFRGYAETWLSRHLGADSTVAGYRSVLRAHVYPAFGHRPLSRVRREDVKNLIAVMRGKGLSSSRVREAHLVVSAIFNEAVRDKMIAVSPCLAIALPEITVNLDFITPTAAQTDAVAAGLPGDWAATVWLMHGCGLRIGEALAVSQRCITGEGTTLRVREQVNPQGQLRPLKFRAAGDYRDTPLPGAASPLRKEERAWLLSLIRREDLLRGPWPAAELVNLAAAGDTQVADFALETLEKNGRNGGDRFLAWSLACNAFAGDSRFKTWVAAQLAKPDHGMILYNAAMIPQRWRDDPAFAQALGPYVAAELTGVTPYNVTGLAPAMPPQEARAALLGSLDSGRPYAAAATLAKRYLDDDVRAALASRLRGDYAHAAPMTGVAIEVLGPGEGFAVLVSLLRQPDEAGRYEQRVVVAQAVADAWQRFEDAVRKQDAEAGPARDVLASYDAAELAALCAAVSPHPLIWHAPSVITAWPGQSAVQQFAARLIRDPSPIVSGIPDTIPPAILRAYCDRTDESSRKIFDAALSLLKHIEPELREVLAFELARSPLGVDDRLDVMAGWKDEPDAEVRRIAFTGLIQAITRHQQARDTVAGDHTFTPEMEWLRQEIKRDLCAYGPELEERRQLAWTGMLMLGDLTLIDGIEETIGHPGAPGVKLEVLYDGDVDEILVDLVAENWHRLRAHFGEAVFERLNGKSDSQRMTAAERRFHVMSALATAASRHPAIAEMLRHEADTEPALRQDRHFLLWAKEENRGDEGTLRALAAKLGDAAHRWQDTVLDSLLDRESWNVTDDVFKAVLTEDALGGRPGRIYASGKLAAYAQLFPADSLTVAALRDLESWFRTDRATREPRGWGDTLAIALGAAEPQDLPAIATRVHTRIRMGMSDLYLPMFTKPLIRRLRADAEAAEAFKAALSDPMGIREDSPIFAGPWDPVADAHDDLQPLQRTYLFAVGLRQAGALSQQDTASVTGFLAAASPDTVVHNPFTNHEGPLCLALLDLAAP